MMLQCLTVIGEIDCTKIIKMSLKLPKLKDVSPKELDSIQQQGIDVLFLAESSDDFMILLSHLSPLEEDCVWRGTKGKITYIVGRNGSEIAALAKVSGTSGNLNSIGGARITDHEATTYWKPRKTQTLLESGLQLK